MKPEWVLSAAVLFLWMTCCTGDQQKVASDAEISPPAGPAGGAIQDIPDAVTDLLVLRSVAAILPAAQFEVIDYLLNDVQCTDEERTQLERYRALYSDDTRATGPDAFPGGNSPLLDDVRLERHGISLIDPRRLQEEVRKLEGALTKECGSMTLLPNTTDREIAVHDFLVFYVRNVRRTCGSEVDWTPDDRDLPSELRYFYKIFKSGHYYKGLHEYITDFRNEPFMKKGNFYTLLYFQYLEHSARAKHVDVPRREFLGRRYDLWDRYSPWVAYTNDDLSLLVSAGKAY